MTKSEAFNAIMADVNALSDKASAGASNLEDGKRTRLTLMVCAAHIVAALAQTPTARRQDPLADLLKGFGRL